MRCRKNVKDLTVAEKKAFVQAIKGLKAQNSVLHPGSQSRYDDYVEIHRSAMDAAQISATGTVLTPGWGHFDSAFFPWHRELLYRFEEDLRSVKPGVTIPYWDWTRGQSAASAAWPFTHDFIGVDGTDANSDRVEREAGAPSPYPYEFDPLTWTVVVTDNPGDPDFLQRGFGERPDAPGLPQNNVTVTGTNTSFRQAIGSVAYTTLRPRSEDLHNLVHRWARGSMIAASSPNDPVFWMHHANIDRMWTLWQEKNPALTPYVHNNGFAGHGLNDTLIFNEAGDPAPWVGTATPNQMIDGHAMHGTSIWYRSDLPALTLASGGSLAFGGMPQGMTQYRAVRFDIRTCRQVRFRITGPPTGNFGLTPFGSQFIVEPDLVADSVDGYVWVQFVANGTSPQFSSVTIEAFIVDDEGYYAANEGGEHSLGTFTVDLSASVIPRDDNAVVLVLDRSGSMAAAAGGSNTRSGLMKSAVGVFHALLRPSDEIGVVSFDDVTENLLTLTTQSGGLGTTLTGPGLDPRNLTGIGLGIQAGAAMLAGATHSNRSLLVLTDGNQNVHPYVEELPAGTLTNRTYAIGFGLPGQVSDTTLNAITQNTQGDLIITGLLATEQERYLLTKHFVQILAGITRANVVLDPENELLLGSEHVTPFQVTEADVSIDVVVLAPVAPFVDLVLRTPDGTEIDPAVAAAEPNMSFHLQPEVAFYRIDLPALPANAGGSHAGTWSIVTRVRKEGDLKRLLRNKDLEIDVQAVRSLLARQSLPYTCIVHARSNLDFSASLSQPAFSPGTSVSVAASLREYGVPFAGTARVWAEVIAPDAATSAIALVPGGPGTYSTSFTASLPGVYRVRIRAEGATSYGSVFTREKSLSATTFVGRPGGVGTDDGVEGGPDRALCELLDCLVETARHSKPLRRLGIDLDHLADCVKRACHDLDRGPVEPRPAKTERLAEPVFEIRTVVGRGVLSAGLADLVEAHAEPVVDWPDAATRMENAATRAKRRQEMARHEDPGLMMFPPIDDEGRAVVDEHGPDCGPDCRHDRGDHSPGHGDQGRGEEPAPKRSAKPAAKKVARSGTRKRS